MVRVKWLSEDWGPLIAVYIMEEFLTLDPPAIVLSWEHGEA